MRRSLILLAVACTAALVGCGPSTYEQAEACGLQTSVVADAIDTTAFEVSDDDLRLPLDDPAQRPTAPQEDRISRCFVTSSQTELRLIADVVDNDADVEDVRRPFTSSQESFTDAYATADAAGALCGNTRTRITFDEGSADPEAVRALIETFADAAGCRQAG